MSVSSPYTVLRILLGPTASGKERLALDCAERLGAEIVSVDSMKIYRGLDIGTAKPTRADRARVPHHALDIAEPEDGFSVADYLAAAEAAIAGIHARGKIAVLSGGTALYYKALLEGLFDGPAAEEEIRERWRGAAERNGVESLHAELARRDPAAAVKIHPRDLRRLVRALEVTELTRAPLSQKQNQWSGFHAAPGSGGGAPPPAYRFPFVMARLDWPRAELHARVAERVERMRRNGLVEEARGVWERRASLARGPLQAVAYKEFFDYFEGRGSLADALLKLVAHTRQLVKSQSTWFRKFPARGLPMDDSVTAGAVLALWDAAGERAVSAPG